MEPLDRAITELTVAASSPVGTVEELKGPLGEVMKLAMRGGPETQATALRTMADIVETADAERAAMVALGCGAIVENGGDPKAALSSILDRLTELMIAAKAFVEACRAAAPARKGDEEGEPEEEEDFLDRYGAEVGERMPQEVAAWRALEGTGLAAIAMLSRSVEARRESKRRTDLLALAGALAPFHDKANFLAKMLQVLDDEELIVLHPGLGKGYRVQIRGIADNFQFHTLLADALIGNFSGKWIPGKRPDPRVVAAAKDKPVDPAARGANGAFNLVNWHGLRPDGTLIGDLSGSDHWIWNEGIPADIAPFEGLRVVLLGPAPYARSWNADRAFDGMHADLQVVEVLSRDAVRGWLDRIAKAPR